MRFDFSPVILSDFHRGRFPYHHTSIMKVKQVNGTQYFTGSFHVLNRLRDLFVNLISVREVQIVSVDDCKW